jgi:DHA1 family bicyclomycin/chloramphenicol resistance-like MFS transporter
VTLPNPVESAGNVAPPRGFGVLELLLGGLAALGPLSIDMYLPALTAIGDDFHVPTAAVQYSLASFFAGFAVAQLIAGPLVDRYGRRRPLLLALVLYMLASLGCAAAPSNEWLIAFRLLQGLAGSVAVVVPRAVVRDLHSGTAAVHMLSRLMLVMGVAPIVAPILGSWVLAAHSWQAIFVFLAGFGALTLFACLRLLPETGRPYDPKATLGTSLRALAREPDFRAYTFCGGFSSAGMFAYISGSTFVFVEVHGVHADHYSYFFGANAFGLIAASQLNRVLVGRFTAVQVLGAATSLAATAALALLAVAITGAGGLWGIAGTLFVFVSSLGILGPNSTALALEHHGARAGLASAVLGSLQFTIAAGAAAAVSVLQAPDTPGAAPELTAVPMALVVAITACLSWSSFMLRRREPAGA